MKSRLFVFTLTAIMLAVLAGWGFAHGSFTVQPVRAASGYSAASLKGTFGYTLQGQVGSNTPLVGVGLVVLDGNGGVSGTETSQVYGVGTQTSTFQGSYTVGNDGCGTLVINYPPAPVDLTNPDAPPPPQAVTAKYGFVIVRGLTEIKAVRADNGTTVTADFRLQ